MLNSEGLRSLNKLPGREQVRINHFIRAQELRVIGEEGANFGVLTLREALKKAEEFGLDLIEISPLATPPVAKIMDFGKFQYDQNKKVKQTRSRSHAVETKSLQIKVGTGDHDLDLKARKASEWLREGHRVKIDLFLPGRTKFMDIKFLKERLERILKLVSEPYKVSEEAKKTPKGLGLVIERDSAKK